MDPPNAPGRGKAPGEHPRKRPIPIVLASVELAIAGAAMAIGRGDPAVTGRTRRGNLILR